MKYLSLLCILLILVGCTDSSFDNIPVNENEEFFATFEKVDSRTYVDEQIRLRWNAEDCITLFKKTTYNREYMFTGSSGANAGGFRQKSIDDEFWYGTEVPYNYAVYPHSSATQLDETNHYFTLTMPAEQNYVENSFGLGANTMVAVSENGQLTFKNVGSYLRVRLYGENIKISSITLISKSNEAIAGTAKVTPVKNGNPTCEMIGTGKSIRLSCTTPVTISSEANAPTDFWIVVPPVTLTKGFSIIAEDINGNTQVYDVDKSVTFERNQYNNLKREVNFKFDIPNNQIWYISKDNSKIYFDWTDEDMLLDANIISNEMNNNVGVITFDKEITTIINLPSTFTVNVKALMMPNSITRFIAMHSAYNLASVQFSENLEELGGFSECKKLTSVILPDNLKRLNAFANCENLEIITLSSKLEDMEGNKLLGSFFGCSAIKEIHCKASIPPINANFDSDLYSTCKVYVPKGSLEEYKSATGWKNFINIIEE